MRRSPFVAALLAVLSCQQLEPGRATAAREAAWLATEERLDAEARQLAPQLEVLARQPGSERVVEALALLESARVQLHKTRVTMVSEPPPPAKDPATAEEQLKGADVRMSAAVQRLETRLAYARTLTSTTPARPEQKKDPEAAVPPQPEP